MSTIVITGSTKGIGRGLAAGFIERGHSVVICSRRQADVDTAVGELDAAGTDPLGVCPQTTESTYIGRCTGRTCDVSSKEELQALWDHAVATFGAIDIWINNAGTAMTRHEIHELPEAMTRTLVDSNLLGTTFASQVAIDGFRKQGHGALYNVLGGTFEGRFMVPNMGVYSATKAAVHTLTRYLVKENKDQNIIVGSISPGTLISDNWLNEQKTLSPEEWEKFKPIMNILCDHVEDVAPWLVDQILANKKQGRRIAWMNNAKMMQRFFIAKVLGRKRDMFSRYGL